MLLLGRDLPERDCLKCRQGALTADAEVYEPRMSRIITDIGEEMNFKVSTHIRDNP
jgi:hypothetical protein